jgi:DNA-binding MarR family transcriptional regulator
MAAVVSTDVDVRVLRAIRRILRAVDLYSRRLSQRHRVTAPQLVCLMAIAESKRLSTTGLARLVQLSPSTVVGILDRLEKKELVVRTRDLRDRRCVLLSLTRKGRSLVRRAPSPLQDRLAEGLLRLPRKEQEAIVRSLERLVDLMEAGDLDAAPLLETGPITEGSSRSR